MKSSTLRRSNLSKEKMAVLEALSKYRQDSYDNSPHVYVRPDKEKELDLLWQSFKISQKAEKSPSVYLATGFIAGAISMLIVTTLISFSVRGIDNAGQAQAPKPRMKKEKLSFIPAGEQATTGSTTISEVYTVQNGDTIESILIRFYGSYSPEKAIAVQQANKLPNLNKISIGQQLSIPMN